ncbi:MAG TPA: hypothetical protein VJT76_03850 [Gaiella sp.]|nr:hypothetical protein [Gaiella sp.]
MEPFVWETEPIEPLNDRIGRQMLNGDAMTLARITLARGAVVPEHSHPNEQIATVLSGACGSASAARNASSTRGPAS